MSTLSIIILSSIGTALVFSFIVGLWMTRTGPWSPWTYEQDRDLFRQFSKFARAIDKKYEPRKQSGTKIDSAA